MSSGDAVAAPVRGRATLLAVPTIVDGRGALSVAAEDWLPFTPRRLYWLHGNATEAVRGGHAHLQLRQFMIAMCGRVTIDIDDGAERQTFVLDRPDVGLLVEPIVWRDIQMSATSVLAVLASDVYKEEDYIRDYNAFHAVVGS
ncbi:MAG: sugar 3,4-ketoisomerase [Solirubrobacterales bacterium]